jgi:hypothetical protein
MLRMTYPTYQYTEYKTIYLELSQPQLKNVKRCMIKIMSHLFRKSFKLLLEINDHPPIPFLTLNSYTNEGITRHHTEPITITPLTREIPVQYLKTGKNSFRFYAYAPLEIPSGLIPTLNEGILALVRE